MLLKDASERFKELFLLAFTRELILHASGKEIIELESEVEKAEEQRKEIIKETVKSELTPKSKEVREVKEALRPRAPLSMYKPLPRPITAPPKRLTIPASKLPPRLAYIQPVARPGIQINLGKLNPLVQDPNVQIIECHGPDKPIIVRIPSEKKTNINLTKEEIDNIINTFSEQAKIPVSEGVFRVAIGQLLLSSIISDVVGSKFIIKKLRYSPLTERQTPSNLKPTPVFGISPR